MQTEEPDKPALEDKDSQTIEQADNKSAEECQECKKLTEELSLIKESQDK